VLLAASIATTLVTWGMSTSLATKDRPRITAKWATVDQRIVLSGTVSAQGLGANDRLTITAVRLLNNGDVIPVLPASPAPDFSPTPRPHFVYWAGIIYQQFIGPDVDGNVSVPFEVPLPAGYPGMLIIASLQGYQDCPAPASGPTGLASTLAPNGRTAYVVPMAVAPDYACLYIDAPRLSSSQTSTSQTGAHTPR
jgi:hypothetical protein